VLSIKLLVDVASPKKEKQIGSEKGYIFFVCQTE
jgi:hypothetical protein